MFDLTSFRRDLLCVIAGMEGAKGVAIKTELESAYEKQIHYVQIYQNLDALVEMGLVTKGSLDGRTNSYSLTDRGSREIKDRQEWKQTYLDKR